MIRIECTGADSLPLDAIEEFQGNLKKRSKKDIDLIIKSIEKYGFSFPFFIWNGTGHNYCLDGHGRIQALSELRRRGEDLPMFPVVYVEAKDEAEAKNKLLRLNSQYGQMTVESVLEFAGSVAVEMEELKLPDGSFLEFDNSNDEKTDDLYTKKIDAPVYEITGEKPSLSDMVNTEKYDELIQEIESADISDEDKKMLKIASTRHIICNYHNMAEYYAHADEKVQSLMEKNALVIIDFNSAIENGYVALSKNVIEQYEEEYAE